ncbi:MAG: PQQ-binding-like beta-propeller repeat protein, partial [Planctomycetota bacterium]
MQRIVALLCLVSLALAVSVRGEDWPMRRHDLARSGVTGEQLPTPLHRQWTHVPAHKPMPAWPEPGRELNRLAFDYAFDVVVADGLAYYGSSADGKVYALDLATGRRRWSFQTEGPIRFSPMVAGGRVFVGSDDGFLYCLSAGEGTLLWKFRGGPRDEKLLGNGRMISRWPLRTGVAVEDGIVYVTAGMWPSEGIYVHALRAETGAKVWTNASSGTRYVPQPHPGSFAMTGVSPQGYLLAREGQLFVPTGRSVPAAFDRGTGKLQYYRSQPTTWGHRWGGCWAFLAEGLLFNWRCHVGPDIDVMLGEYEPDKDDGMVCFDAATGKEVREVTGKLDAVVSDGVLYATGGGKVAAYPLKQWVGGAKPADCARWEAVVGLP